MTEGGSLPSAGSKWSPTRMSFCCPRLLTLSQVLSAWLLLWKMRVCIAWPSESAFCTDWGTNVRGMDSVSKTMEMCADIRVSEGNIKRFMIDADMI